MTVEEAKPATTPLTANGLHWIGLKIDGHKEVIKKFQDEVAKGTSLQYIAEWLTGKAVEAEESLKYLLWVQRAGSREALEDTLQELESQIMMAARGGTHRSTDGWTNCSSASKLSAQARLLEDLKGVLRFEHEWVKKQS